MALEFQEEVNNSGVTANYWKIIKIVIDYWDNSTIVTLALYKNLASKLANKTVLAQEIISLTGDNNPFKEKEADGDVRKAVYKKLKSIPRFSGAKDA